MFDAAVLEGKAFEPLRNPDVFNSATVEFGMVVWNNGEIDCDPEYMHEHSLQCIPCVGGIVVKKVQTGKEQKLYKSEKNKNRGASFDGRLR